MNYITAFKRSVNHFPNRVLIEKPSGETYTYREVDRRTNALAAELDDRLGTERCAALVQNSLPAIETILAAQKRGQANVQLSFRSTPQQIEHMLETASATGLIVDDANAALATKVLDRVSLDAVYHVGDDPGNLAETTEYESVVSRNGAYEIDNTDSAESAVVFTSGTTGMPKAVPQNQEQTWLASTQVVMEHGFKPTDVGLVLTPWYHDVTMVAWILPHIQVGARLIPQADFDPIAALETVEERHVTGFLAVPAQIRSMLKAQKNTDADLSSLDQIRSGGAMVPPDIVVDSNQTFDAEFHNTYGLTEGIASLTHAYPFEQDDNPGTVGKTSFVWDEVRVVEPADPPAEPNINATVDPGESGEIIGKGPHTDGYIDRPESTERLFVDGWLRTGDIARIDNNGGLHVVDRIDNMIVSGGENVYPQEVELVLNKHSAVDEAAVVGIPDEEWGQKIGTVVVQNTDVREAELDRWCLESDELEDFKRPREYVLLDESFDRSETGTLNREAIRNQYFD